MSQVADWLLFVFTVSWEYRAEIVVFSPIPVKVMEKAYSCVAPGSPVMAAPLFVVTEFAR